MELFSIRIQRTFQLVSTDAVGMVAKIVRIFCTDDCKCNIHIYFIEFN